MTIPEDLKYTEEHEWVRINGDIATIGISHHAQQALGDIVYVEVPELDTDVEAREAFIVVESVKAVSDVYAPIAGKVTAINESLEDSPELINSDTYGDGWIVKLLIGDVDTSSLMDASSYAKFVAE
ncbi:MAG: glycine cleavage system protein GcvH [Mariprofundales bacterium]